MTITFIARCDGKDCRHRSKAGTRGWFKAVHVYAGQATDVHACCATCKHDIDARRARMQLPALTWMKES